MIKTPYPWSLLFMRIASGTLRPTSYGTSDSSLSFIKMFSYSTKFLSKSKKPIFIDYFLYTSSPYMQKPYLILKLVIIPSSYLNSYEILFGPLVLSH